MVILLIEHAFVVGILDGCFFKAWPIKPEYNKGQIKFFSREQTPYNNKPYHIDLGQ